MIDARTNYEKAEERRNDILERMTKYEEESPEFRNLATVYKIMSEANGGYEERENTRLSNNQKNETEYESKVRLEAEQIKNEKLKNAVKILEDIGWAGLTIYALRSSYHMEEFGQSFKPMLNSVREFASNITKWKR